jgi:hypothetical protein
VSDCRTTPSREQLLHCLVDDELDSATTQYLLLLESPQQCVRLARLQLLKHLVRVAYEDVNYSRGASIADKGIRANYRKLKE